MLSRVLEPEIMDTEEDAAEYDSIPNDDVNAEFVEETLNLASINAIKLVDLGSGPAHIPILFALKRPQLIITAVELAEEMIVIAQQNIKNANVEDRIIIRKQDIKHTMLTEKSFDIVISNSCIHHMHNPIELFAEAKRLVSNGGVIYFKDLLRPKSLVELEHLVSQYAYDASDYQRVLFRNSLHAALTLDEVKVSAEAAGLSNASIKQTSDRHWSLCYIK
ncbi:protein YxbB [Rickettsiales endosymbiont of Trichoplax sp. H2]|nr:methyltransferase domain-containing protein [Rickettsiales endosymbiont of Trichoplax sp. H2]MSO13382.1 protein YxbB [Rickettsiales endosymbiont of Trichoplax sp. H2]